MQIRVLADITLELPTGFTSSELVLQGRLLQSTPPTQEHRFFYIYGANLVPQCTSAPHRKPELALKGTNGALPLEDLDILSCVALTHLTDGNLKPPYLLHTI